MKLRQTFTKLAPAMLVVTFAAGSALAQDAVHKQDGTRTTAPGAANAPAAPATPAMPATAARPQAVETNVVLTDGQVLQIVRTLNDAEIKQANEAIDQSKSADVKQVAEMIKADHEQANEQIDDLLKGSLNLDNSDLNKTLATNAEKTHERLQDLDGAQYDCAYLQQQVEQHKAALSTASNVLSPNVKVTEVKQFLTAVSPKLEHHQQMAQAALGKSASCKQVSLK